VPQRARLDAIILGGAPLARPSPELEAERAAAIADLLAENHFAPRSAPHGPYRLHLAIADGRLLFDIRDRSDHAIGAVILALGPFRRLIKDYLMLLDAWHGAHNEGAESRLQAIDMGRRGLHNEGAELLRERLAGKIEIDFRTARRLFTLVCVLHQRL